MMNKMMEMAIDMIADATRTVLGDDVKVEEVASFVNTMLSPSAFGL